jgi:membrane fusion protein (multidrug efflux system)
MTAIGGTRLRAPRGGQQMKELSKPLRALPVFALALLASGCGDGQKAAQAPAAPPPAVTVVRVAGEEVKPTVSFSGRVVAQEKVDLRARVEGFLEKREFREGGDVKEGELLFVIEKGLYLAAVEQAKGALAKAQASEKLGQLEVDRQTELFQKNVSAKATLDTAVARLGEAHGEVLSQMAALDRAMLNLSYTDIKAPIPGRIGRAAITVGNFVSPSSGTLATIVRQDPMYVTFPVTQREMLEVRKQTGAPANPTDYVIYIQLADGSRYDKPGKLNFLDVTVNQGTDTVTVRAVFPNPDRVLVDGALVTVTAETGKGERVVLVPQQALQLDQTGPYVLLVDKDSKVQVRRIELGAAIPPRIVVSKGLEAGDLVVTEGIQRVRPGQVVQATEAKPGV